MEPFRDREMDSSQRSIDSGPGGRGQQQQRGAPAGKSPAHHAPGAALAPPPSLGSIGSPGMQGPAPSLPSNATGYGYHGGQSLPAPAGQHAQNQRLLQMQRQQQLRQMHQQQQQRQQQQHPTNQQSQNLSQLQHNYMQHLAADNSNRANAQRNAPNAAAPFTGHATNQQQQQTPSPSNLKQNGMQPPLPSPSLMTNRTNSNASLGYHPSNNNPAAQGGSSISSSPAFPKPINSQNNNYMAPPPGNLKGALPSSSSSSKPAARSGVGPLPMASNTNTTTHPNMPPPSSASTTTAVNGGTTSSMVASTATLPPLTAIPDKEMPALLAKCDWKDKTLWVSRHLLGGQALNGFSRSTANVQRIRRQRARQVKSTAAANNSKTEGGIKTDDAASVSSTPSATGTTSAGKKREAPAGTIESEEEMKLLILNARTAKKVKSEMDVALKFCETMHETIRAILRDMGVAGVPVPAPLGRELPMVPAGTPGAPPMRLPMAVAAAPRPPVPAKQAPRPIQMPPPATPLPPVAAPTPALPVPPVAQGLPQQDANTPSTTAAGSAKNSTLRRARKKKVQPSNDLNVGLSEFDATGKRLLSRKDYSQRVFEVVRFRALRNGDHVAARLSSRDLWILARVTKDYPTVNIPAVEFLQLSVAKRDGLFRDKVFLRDVEDKESGPNAVARSLVLPLPRNYSEAAEWGQHYRKGSRVYAMYPETTSLYTATVVDNTTYCQGDDDIIVVEFDGDESDHTGSPPKCHIPARFVSFIPREFPAAQEKPVRRQSAVAVPPPAPAAATAAPAPTAAPGALPGAFEDPLNSLDLSLDPFDDLEFDLGFN